MGEEKELVIACYTNCVSPHQLPLAREIVRRTGSDNFRYVYRDERSQERAVTWWDNKGMPAWCTHGDENTPELLAADVLYCGGLRPFELFEKRLKNGKKTLYVTERWFKPPIGMLRLLHPRYFCYARQIAKMMDNPDFMVLPIGVHAAKDIARLCGLMHGDLRCLFRAPELEFENRPGGKIGVSGQCLGVSGHGLGVSQMCRLDKMRMWGYFVESSKFKVQSEKLKEGLRVLWVGRMLKLKRVDAIILAVGELSTRTACSTRLVLDIFGTGPEELRLRKMAARYGDAIKFHPPVPIGEVRKLMREHDLYVFGSNGYEGWGAVVSEALEEGIDVIGTFEAGASSTMLPKERLFHCGDVKALTGLLKKERDRMLPPCAIGEWTAEAAAKRLVNEL